MEKSLIAHQAEMLREKHEKDQGDQVVQIYTEAIRDVAQSAAKQVVDKLNKAALKAIKRVDEMIESPNEDIATRNAHFAINHVLGTPVNKSISRVERVNVDVLAD